MVVEYPAFSEVARVPQDDCGDEEVQAGSAVLLVLVGAVADLAEAMDEDSPRQAVACFALVEFPARPARLGACEPDRGLHLGVEPLATENHDRMQSLRIMPEAALEAA